MYNRRESMRNLPNIWIDSLVTYDEVLDHLELNLSILKENAQEVNFSDKKAKKQYSDNVMFMKQFFERAEFLARTGQ